MSLFSEVLKEYVKGSRRSVSKLSLEAEIDRTLFHKYLSGNRLPKNRKEVKRIAHTLMLPPNQQDILLEHYAKSVYGEKNYESFGKIRHILGGMHDLRIAEGQKILDVDIVQKLSQTDKKDGLAFCGKLQVEDALIQLLWLAAGRGGKGRVQAKMMVQPDQENIIKPILRVCSRLDIELEHIICLDCDRNDNDNIGLLRSVLAFEFSNVTYQSYFYYGNPGYQANQMSLLPNLVLVGGFAFLCSSGADDCLILRQEAEVGFFQREYEKIKSNTEKLGMAIQDAGELAEAVGVMTGKSPVELQLGHAPYLLLGIHEKMLQGHLLLEPKMKEPVLQAARQSVERAMEGRGFQDYFAEPGLRSFLETGQIPGYPPQVLHPFAPQERAAILTRLLQLLKGDYFSFYMADEAKLQLDCGVMVFASREGDVNFWYRKGIYGKAITVREASIRDSLYRFADYAKENGWFYGRRETIWRMERLLVEFTPCGRC